jgi:hypothetical protein
VIVIDEYLALDVLGGRWPDGLADDDQLGPPPTTTDFCSGSTSPAAVVSAPSWAA